MEERILVDTTKVKEVLTIEQEEKKVEEYLKRKSSSQSQEVQDTDYHFLMSLLTSLRATLAYRKLMLRRKIEGLFLQEEGYSTKVEFNYSLQPSTSAGSHQSVVSPGGQSDVSSIGDHMNAGPYEDAELTQLIAGYKGSVYNKLL
ncbi:unnamed protein product [Psylliodes chrysocephalus]|uniref:Uncharacterized protein n=1 Tax=Psylliodes chrysocephalus TaxID=3402493 RepID=A0A9P0CXF0_9CUCU|nr:unnamed protein product [Psylliodes chrysocephala]